MTQSEKVPVKTQAKAAVPQVWRPFENFRREFDRLLDDFGGEFWRSPLARREVAAVGAPAVDIADKDNAYEVTADVPGFDEKSIEVKVANGSLSIKGEKKSEKEEKQEGYFLSERTFGSFSRSFALPDGVDTDKIEAKVSNGVLTVVLPKKAEAQQPVRKIEVKAAA
jgi:HSP20 family protein